ncbi:hypothetical protein [Bacillus badius]|uniref:hypothetical protein n=1 Tax=Bacillus badius TaxID=1455 RepID=UPI002E1AEE0D|nr:hypothetical protein [Bacillus badius]
MAITERDKKIVYWINKHGFATAEQVGKEFGMSKTAVYRRLKGMVDEGLLKHGRVLADIAGVYWVTNNGVELSESKLSAGKKPGAATLAHDLKMIDLSMYLLKEYENCTWLTAREMKSMQMKEAEKTGENKFAVLGSRVPDGVLVMGGQYYAVELELTLKNRKRIKGIVDDYAKRMARGEFASVIYYYDKESVARVLHEEVASKAVVRRFQFFEVPKDI